MRCSSCICSPLPLHILIYSVLAAAAFVLWAVVNWWIDSKPVTVMAMGDLDFYGRENAEERGVTKFYDRYALYLLTVFATLCV